MLIPNRLSTDETNGFTGVFVGFYVYVSNTTNKDDGQLCFHDNEYFNLSTIPAVLTLNCTLHGRYVIYYNERNDDRPDYYFEFAEIDLCEFEVNGKNSSCSFMLHWVTHTLNFAYTDKSIIWNICWVLKVSLEIKHDVYICNIYDTINIYIKTKIISATQFQSLLNGSLNDSLAL